MIWCSVCTLVWEITDVHSHCDEVSNTLICGPRDGTSDSIFHTCHDSAQKVLHIKVRVFKVSPQLISKLIEY